MVCAICAVLFVAKPIQTDFLHLVLVLASRDGSLGSFELGLGAT